MDSQITQNSADKSPEVSTPVLAPAVGYNKNHVYLYSALAAVGLIALTAIVLLLINLNSKPKTNENSIANTPTPAVSSTTDATQAVTNIPSVTKASATVTPNVIKSSDTVTTPFSETLSDEYISDTYKVLITGEFVQSKDTIASGEGIKISKDAPGGVLIIKGGGFDLSLTTLPESEIVFDYKSAVMVGGAKIAGLGRIFDESGGKGYGFWRYFDDKSETDCVGSTTIHAPCGTGYVLKNGEGIYAISCYEDTAKTCDAIMKTVDIKVLSE